LWWERINTITGWKGEYFGNRSLAGAPLIVRDDPDINFDWGTRAPFPGAPADNWSVRWTREVDSTQARTGLRPKLTTVCGCG